MDGTIPFRPEIVSGYLAGVNTQFTGNSATARSQAPAQARVTIATSYLYLQAAPEVLLGYNRQHWRIGNNLRRKKDAVLREDDYTKVKDNAPRTIFSRNYLVLRLFKKRV